MSDDFLSRVRAEALRRIEAERFECAVIEEIKKIREAERIAAEIPRYRKFHEERKEKLRRVAEVGAIESPMAEIEIAVSDYALGNITLYDVYKVVDTVDSDYPNKYLTHFQGMSIGYRSKSIYCPHARRDVPYAFSMYLQIAVGPINVRNKQKHFNKFSMLVMN